MRTWIDVAVLAKTRNSKGRFVVRATTGLPFLLEPGDEVALVPPQIDVPRNVVVGEVRPIDDMQAELTFEGVDAPDLARQMVGMHCLIRRELVDEAVFSEAPGTWDGWRVIDDVDGFIGEVSDVIENPAQTLLEVTRPNGQTVLVPAVDAIVHDVDVEKQAVFVMLPNGLLEL